MARRRTALLALAAAALAGCGFELRRPERLPFSRLALTGFQPRSPVADALRQALPSQVRVVSGPAEAEMVLVAIEERFDKTVAASTAGAQLRAAVRPVQADGSPQLGETRLELTRDMSYSETAALAKQAEEAGLVREMRADLAQQLLHMLAATGPHAKG